jgi:hypothetical protein
MYRTKLPVLTLENMCVIGEVTLILKRPETQSRNPKKPVIKEPHKNRLPFQLAVERRSLNLKSSPPSRTKGRRKMAEPRFVQ